MAGLEWLEKFPDDVAGLSGKPTADNTTEVPGVTDVRLVKAPKELGAFPIHLVKDCDALKGLTAHVQSGLVKGASKMDVRYITLENPCVQTVTVKASPDLPWFLELLKNLTSAFFTSGAAALAAGIASLIIGSPVTLWMFLASLASLLLGVLSHLGYLQLG
jgi:hypothetical protein